MFVSGIELGIGGERYWELVHDLEPEKTVRTRDDYETCLEAIVAEVYVLCYDQKLEQEILRQKITSGTFHTDADGVIYYYL